MKRRMLLRLVLGVAGALGLASSVSGQTLTSSEHTNLLDQVAGFLEAYQRNDQEMIRTLVDPDQLDVYGSDAAEHAVGVDAFLAMMDADHALWALGGEVQIGEMDRVSVRVNDDLATVFFHAPFQNGGNPELTVRFTTVWKRTDGNWLLTQSSNTVPTVGASARDLLQQ